MKMDIYNKDGYIDIKKIMKEIDPTMLIIIGGRGIGKTYNVLDYLIETGERFILARRTNSEREFIRTQEDFNPLSALRYNNVIPEFNIEGGKYSDSYYFEGEENPFCFCVSLATSAKIRGMSGHNIKAIYYDEFIKDNNEKGIKDEAGGFFQLVETIGRNREISGEKPLKLILTANSNNIFNPICDTLRLTDIFLDMRKNDQELRYLKSRGVLLCDVKKSPISELKKQTFLYKLTENTEFYDMAVNNEYYNDISVYIGNPYPIREYKPFADIKDIHILRHSSNRLLYITYKNRGTARNQFLKVDDYLKEYGVFMKSCFRVGCVFFENMDIASYFKDFI